MNKYKLIFLFFCVFLLVSIAAQAKINDHKSAGPLFVRTQNPLYLKYLAMPMESPQTLSKGHWEQKIQTTFSNVFEYDPVSNTQTNIDMEIWRTEFAFVYGVSDSLDVGVQIPFVSNTGGFLDSFVQWYHGLFGFPNGGRDLVSNNEFHFEISQNGNVLVNYSQESLGLSDVVLRAKYQLSKHIKLPLHTAVAGYVKIPVGRASKGISSGQMDAGVSVFASKTFFKRLNLFSQAGLTILGEDNTLTNIQKRILFVFGQSFEYQFLDWLSLIVQLTGNTTAFTGVDTTDLKDPVLDLNVGFAGKKKLKSKKFKEFFYQWSFSEDVLSRGPSVDFSVLFLAGVRY